MHRFPSWLYWRRNLSELETNWVMSTCSKLAYDVLFRKLRSDLPAVQLSHQRLDDELGRDHGGDYVAFGEGCLTGSLLARYFLDSSSFNTASSSSFAFTAGFGLTGLAVVFFIALNNINKQFVIRIYALGRSSRPAP
jgi:hypothetical protein